MKRPSASDRQITSGVVCTICRRRASEFLELALEALAVRHVPGDPVDADELPVVEVADDVDLERDLAPVGVAERDPCVLDHVGCRDQRRVARRGEGQGMLGNVVGERAPDRLPDTPAEDRRCRVTDEGVDTLRIRREDHVRR